jgi:hypothetical protein
MANSALRGVGGIIHLDTFTAVINFADIFPKGMKINSIEWSKPTSTDHTFTILAGGSSGLPVFKEQCTVANQSIIKYFKGKWLKPLYLAIAAANEKASGEIIITLDMD